jgi:hypothetical protein
MKSINLYNKQSPAKPPPKTREKINNLPNDISLNIIQNINNYPYQLNLINLLYLQQPFSEQKFLIGELKSKISSYRQQDIKKNINEQHNIIAAIKIILIFISYSFSFFLLNTCLNLP